jgi:exo-beta-1,3-glucanase (GH17 family)
MGQLRRVISLILVFVSAAAASPKQLHGLNFGPFLPGENPQNTILSAAQIRQRMRIVAPHTKWIRGFGATRGWEHFPAIGRELWLKVVHTAWISNNLVANQAEIAGLIAAANSGNVDIALVGSEALLRGDVAASALVTYIQQVRAAIPANVPIGTADTYTMLLANTSVMSACDVVFANIYPFWQSIPAPDSMNFLADRYRQVVSAAAGLPGPPRGVVLSETGWPTSGSPRGAAQPSLSPMRPRIFGR